MLHSLRDKPDYHVPGVAPRAIGNNKRNCRRVMRDCYIYGLFFDAHRRSPEMIPINCTAARASSSDTDGTNGRPCPVPVLLRSAFTAHSASYSRAVLAASCPLHFPPVSLHYCTAFCFHQLLPAFTMSSVARATKPASGAGATRFSSDSKGSGQSAGEESLPLRQAFVLPFRQMNRHRPGASLLVTDSRKLR